MLQRIKPVHSISVAVQRFLFMVTFTGVISGEDSYGTGGRFFYFPGDGDKSLHLVDTWEPADLNFIEDYTRHPANNSYWLFTRENPTDAQILNINETQSIKGSNFKRNRNVVFIVHGWYGHGGNDLSKLLTKAFLEDSNVNVIVFDWSKLARRNYLTAKSGIPAMGSTLGHFINWLTKFGVSYDRVHLVGFSLGAHLVGVAGRKTGSQVRRITALDPAGPLWGNDESRIVRTDAQYVEVIHTNTALYGFTDPCGDADFYPNGGSSMPGCWLNMCSHSRAYEYMAATVRYNHLHGNRCPPPVIRADCAGDALPMGNSNLSKTGSGIYVVNTRKKYPF